MKTPSQPKRVWSVEAYAENETSGTIHNPIPTSMGALTASEYKRLCRLIKDFARSIKADRS